LRQRQRINNMTIQMNGFRMHGFLLLRIEMREAYRLSFSIILATRVIPLRTLRVVERSVVEERSLRQIEQDAATLLPVFKEERASVWAMGDCHGGQSPMAVYTP